MQIKILLVEDQKLMRIGIKSLFCDYPDLEIIGEAINGKEAIEKARLIKPDIVLMDIGLPDISGIEATKQILENNNHIKIIMLTSHISEEELNSALIAGASAYIIKDIGTDFLMSAIKMVKEGAMWIDPHVVPFIRDKNCGVKMAIKEEPKNDLRSSSCVLVIGRCFKRDPTFLDSTERQFNLGELKRSISASTHIVTLLKSDYRVFGE